MPATWVEDQKVRQAVCTGPRSHRARHAFEFINSTSDDKLARLDGVFIVLWLVQRTILEVRFFLFPNKNFRIGIIPAGSTDSIAVSTTGS